MPEAWCTTYWKSAPASSSAASCPGGAFGLQHEDRLGGDVGHDQRVGVLVVGERPRSVAVQVERAEADRSHLEREAEHGPHARLERRPGEREPAGR